MKQAMIFAAGLGTRLKPLTDTMPKALVKVGEQPLLWHVVMKLKAAGFERIVVNVHHFAQQIIDYLEANGRFGLDIRLSDESDGLLETGGGIKKARPLFDSNAPVLIHNVDILSNADLTAFYDSALTQQADALLMVSERTTKRYLLFDDDNLLRGWTNIETGELRPATLRQEQISIHPSCDPSVASDQRSSAPFTLHQRAFSGIHVLSPRLFPLMDDMPERFGIIDFYLKHCTDRRLMGHEQPGLQLLDVGKLDTLDAAERFLL